MCRLFACLLSIAVWSACGPGPDPQVPDASSEAADAGPMRSELDLRLSRHDVWRSVALDPDALVDGPDSIGRLLSLAIFTPYAGEGALPVAAPLAFEQYTAPFLDRRWLETTGLPQPFPADTSTLRADLTRPHRVRVDTSPNGGNVRSCRSLQVLADPLLRLLVGVLHGEVGVVPERAVFHLEL